MTRSFYLCLAMFFAAMLSVASVVHSQSATPAGSLTGTVLSDSGDAPVADAEISFPDQKLSVRSDSKGNFQIGGLPTGAHALLVRRVGYEPYSATLTFRPGQKVEADFFMKPIVTKLANVNVKAAANPRYAIQLADFENVAALAQAVS